MDTSTVISLIETVSKTLNEQGFEHITLNHEGTSLTLNKKSVGNSDQGSGVRGQVFAEAAPVAQPSAQSVVTAKAPEVSQAASQPISQSPEPTSGDFKTIDSPIVGTFYDSPSPEAEAYVKVGDQVKKGDVVCIIEAMKLMNEIEAECDGEIVEICASNEGPVEYGQTLFKLK